MATRRARPARSRGEVRRETHRAIRVIDLFAGCGGFSRGAHEAGFEVVGALDSDPILSGSYSFNFPDTRFVWADARSIAGDGIRALGGGRVDGIVGGPPCQGFSSIGRRVLSDPRRRLLWHFFRLVQEANPSFFVMENVKGLSYANACSVLEEALGLVEKHYALLGPVIWNAAEFGAATRRPRLFVVGIHKDKGDALTLEDVARLNCNPATVKAAIADLDGAEPMEDEGGFDRWRITRRGRPSGYAKELRAPDRCFTGHRPTLHSEAVVDRFRQVVPGGIDPVGRHPRLAWASQCPTLRAGTGADRGSYQSVRPIHPGEPRVITVREAARLQGFPDCHRFHPTIWHSFRMIGNSVSPIMAKAIFRAIRRRLEDGSSVPLAAG